MSVGMDIKIFEKPLTSVKPAINGTIKRLIKNIKPQVFSNLKSFVNFSGNAYRPSIIPAEMAQKIPSIIKINKTLFKKDYSDSFDKIGFRIYI